MEYELGVFQKRPAFVMLICGVNVWEAAELLCQVTVI